MELVDLGKPSNCFKFSFRNVSLNKQLAGKQSQDEGLKILENVSGLFASGRMVCILGPSGAGKSSLLNVLSGHKQTGASGQIFFEGRLLNKRLQRKLVSYTPQSASLWMNLTAQECLEYACDFKLATKSSKYEKISTVRRVLENIGLQKCSETMVKNLSGGELKRLSIGVELVSDPKVMLLDEPTSGLDVISSYQLLSYVQEVARFQNRAVVCVIHQPSSKLLQLFNDVFVLSGGKQIYSGSLETMVDTFARFDFNCPVSHNPADFALEIASMDQTEPRLQHLMDFQEPSVEMTTKINTEIVDDFQISYPLESHDQFRILLKRSLLCTFRDLYNVTARFIICTIISFLIGLVFYDSGNNASKLLMNTAVFMAIIYTQCFTSLFSTIITFPLEADVFIREYKNNWYSLGPYYCAKLASEIPAVILSGTVFYLISYYLTGQPWELHRLLLFWTACFLATWISVLTGLMLSNFFALPSAIFGSVIVVLLTSLFSGFYVTLTDMGWWLKPFSYLSYVRYALEVGFHAIYGLGRREIECPDIFCYFTLRKFCKVWGMPELDWSTDLLALVAYCVAMHFGLYFVLSRRIRLEV
ncbi:ATP-binding cassette sub-family G member 4-like [Uranotaenia lowii]|uniref:ATP-binding cassette sub-family G member 4-like n=1 Tax=Uranotaenia lowii TaxID=190385 RepID=UPI00247AC3DA|nr:ATP-binding cassette sub-family G member 4-like [Uranotaenia lowii]